MARIYIVDDEPHILAVLQTLLETQGHEVVAESNAQAVLEKITAGEEMDLLISDVRMSPLNGIKLLNNVNEVRPSLPVILVTAFFSPESEKEAKQNGAAACIPKPFDITVLLNAVNKAIG